MKVKIILVGLIHLKGIKNRSIIDIKSGSTISDLYDKLKIMKVHQRFIIPFINDNEAKRSTSVNDGDTVKLFLPTGGG
jgi:hypothetical protein